MQPSVSETSSRPRIIREEFTYRGKWLGLKNVHWEDHLGVERVIEFFNLLSYREKIMFDIYENNHFSRFGKHLNAPITEKRRRTVLALHIC
jgi:hypothetical protein